VTVSLELPGPLNSHMVGNGEVIGFWSRDIDREIDTREVMVALLSPGSYGSRACTGQQLRALDKDNRLIPT